MKLCSVVHLMTNLCPKTASTKRRQIHLMRKEENLKYKSFHAVHNFIIVKRCAISDTQSTQQS